MISPFDPWRSQICTCPSKLTFNPYTGCDHACIYCYASSYIPDFFNCRPKKDLLTKLRRAVVRLKGEMVSIANSSDPYPNLEAKTGLMRKCLEILSQQHCKIQIITKSNMVTRDVDILGKVPSMVSLTITTDDNKTAEIIEPHAPSPSKRLEAIEVLVQNHVPVSVRVDPIIPFVNTDSEGLVETLASLGVKHVTGSTYKVKLDNWQRLATALPTVAEKLRLFYFEKGEKIGRTIYLPRDMRIQLMETMRTLVQAHGMKFGVCRENLSCLNTASCDGSWLLHSSI